MDPSKSGYTPLFPEVLRLDEPDSPPLEVSAQAMRSDNTQPTSHVARQADYIPSSIYQRPTSSISRVRGYPNVAQPSNNSSRSQLESIRPMSDSPSPQMSQRKTGALWQPSFNGIPARRMTASPPPQQLARLQSPQTPITRRTDTYPPAGTIQREQNISANTRTLASRPQGPQSLHTSSQRLVTSRRPVRRTSEIFGVHPFQWLTKSDYHRSKTSVNETYDTIAAAPYDDANPANQLASEPMDQTLAHLPSTQEYQQPSREPDPIPSSSLIFPQGHADLLSPIPESTSCTQTTPPSQTTPLVQTDDPDTADFTRLGDSFKTWLQNVRHWMLRSFHLDPPGLLPRWTPTNGSDTSISNVNLFLRNVSTQVYLYLLLCLPTLYYSRVDRIFQEAELSLGQLKKMVLEMALEGKAFYPAESQVSMAASFLPPAYRKLNASWDMFIDSIMREWKTFNIISVLLLTAILTILQLNGAIENPVTRYAAFFSLICALISLLFGCLYIIRFGTMKKAHKAVEWALEAKQTNAILWNVWILLAMPAIWLAWSIIFYLVCVIAFIWISEPSNHTLASTYQEGLVLQSAIMVVLAIGFIYGCLIVSTFRRYGTRMDKEWRRRVKEWQNTSKETPPQLLYQHRGWSAQGTISPADRSSSLLPEIVRIHSSSDTQRPPLNPGSVPESTAHTLLETSSSHLSRSLSQSLRSIQQIPPYRRHDSQPRPPPDAVPQSQFQTPAQMEPELESNGMLAARFSETQPEPIRIPVEGTPHVPLEE